MRDLVILMVKLEVKGTFVVLAFSLGEKVDRRNLPNIFFGAIFFPRELK